MGTPIAPSDLTWLLMDRPNNLMHVHGLMVFDELPDWETAKASVMDRVVTKYRVLSQIPIQRDGHWHWEDDVDFSLDRHVTRVILPDNDPETLRQHVSRQFSRPFDRSVPLWEMQIISGSDEPGGVMLSRWHHGLGDGIRLVQLVIGMCDPIDGAIPKKVGKDSHHNIFERVLHFTEHSVKDTIDFVSHAGDAVGKAGKVIATLNPLDLPHHLESVVDLAKHPLKVIDALTSFSSDDNETSNSWREVSRLLLHEKADAGAWEGHPGIDKSVAWAEAVSLAQIRAVAETFGGTVNDVLMAAVSLALTEYLHERGVEQIHDLAWMMPVSLQPIDGKLPDKLGNHFAVVLYEMPLGITDPAALLEEIHHRSMRLKNSVEPALAFGMQRVIAESPHALARKITDHFSGKTIGQLSNVPGPRTELSFCGAPVRSILGWVPTSGDQPIGVCLFSYNGQVNVGVAVDATLIPDPVRITDLVTAHIAALSAAAGGADSPLS